MTNSNCSSPLSPMKHGNSQSLLANLNESQRAAVCHIEGPVLILAGPGSGKTRVISHRIAYMIQQGISPNRIIGLTFTNKAAGEMRRRLEHLVGHGDVWLGTFHSFCVNLLRRYARLVGLPENFTIYDTDDSMACLKQAVQESQVDISHTPLSALAHHISSFKNRLITPAVLQVEALSSYEYLVSQVYPYYQRVLLRNGAADFDDLLMHTAVMLREYPELREQLDQRFEYLLVDEYQDTNLAQYVILRHLSVNRPNLAATGDPDQSIYGWRGASTTNVASLERDYSQLKIVRLENNYRSTPEILSVADSLIQNNQFRKHKHLLPTRDAGSCVRLTIYPTARAEAEDIAEQILILTQSGDYRLSDFGVLYRTSAQSRLIEQAMMKRRLPYQLIGGYRFYLRKEIKDLIGYLLIAYNPNDDVALQRVINVPPRGIGKQTLCKLQDLAAGRGCSLLSACSIATREKILSPKATRAIAGFLRTFEFISSRLDGSLVHLLESTLEVTEYRRYIQSTATAEEDDYENQQIIDELLAEAQELDADHSDDRPALERFLEVVALQSDADRMKTEQEMVTLMTLHAAKGLEFPCIYLIAVEENILPHARSKDDPMQLEEERRLLFVGITRAKDQLQLSYAKSRGFGNSNQAGVASSFLMELPRHEMSVQDRSQIDPSDDCYSDIGLGDESHIHGESFDEACQLVLDEENGDQLDDDCQLPPEELRQRLLRKTGQQSSRTLRMRPACDLPVIPWTKYRPGSRVNHPQLGVGEILSASGQGPKRTVTVQFTCSGQVRTFRLSHAPLTLEN